ncbi:MAG: hypothetical protein JNM14_10075 [Ferruginibacter sp.]|nr:hypothetical protein [Ferruginibacter sp.]
MRKLFLPLFILFGITTTAQDLSKKIEQARKDLAKQQAAFDSSRKSFDSIYAANLKKRDSIDRVQFTEQNTRNLNSFVKTMQERNRKQKQQMWMRLGFGALMLGVLIFGLLRKRKKKEVQ